MPTTELQLWIIIGLLVLFVGGYFLVALTHLQAHRQEQTTKSGFGELWDRNQLDELILRSKLTLADYPNHQSALYFGAKALWAKGRGAEAKKYFDRLIKLEPDLSETLQRELKLMTEKAG